MNTTYAMELVCYVLLGLMPILGLTALGLGVGNNSLGVTMFGVAMVLAANAIAEFISWVASTGTGLDVVDISSLLGGILCLAAYRRVHNCITPPTH